MQELASGMRNVLPFLIMLSTHECLLHRYDYKKGRYGIGANYLRQVITSIGDICLRNKSSSKTWKSEELRKLERSQNILSRL